MARKLALKRHRQGGTSTWATGLNWGSSIGRRRYVRWLSITLGGLAGMTASVAGESDGEAAHEVEIVGLGHLSSYTITTEGTITPIAPRTAAARQRIYGSSAEGVVTSDVHRFRLDAALEHVAVTGDARVYVDGERLTT